MKKLAIFASGSGTNAENITSYFKNNMNIKVSLILSNKKNAKVLDKAKKLDIPTFIFNKKDFFETDKISKKLSLESIDFIILAGFLLKVPKNLIAQYPNRIINIHPSLLPKYGGKGMYGMNIHHSIIKNKEEKSGITIHFIDENFDEGEIIFQNEIEINKNDTAEGLAQKIHLLEYKYFPKVIEKIVSKL